MVERYIQFKYLFNLRCLSKIPSSTVVWIKERVNQIEEIRLRKED